MSATSDGAFANLSVSKTIFLNDVVINGLITLNSDKLHDHNYGVFESSASNEDDIQVLHVLEDGSYVELYLESRTNANISTRCAETYHRDGIRFTNMHYDHAINDRYVYRFLSDKRKLLLTTVGHQTTSIVLTKKS